MVRLLYTPLASVQFMHSFYQNGISNDFALTPTAATLALLQTYDWVARSLGNTFTLLGREDEPGQPTTPLDEPILLTFIVQLTNPLLANVSDWGGGNGPFYLTNLNASDGSSKTSLTIGPTLSSADQLPLITGQQFSLSLEKDVYKSLTISQVQPGAGLKPIQNIPIKAGQETLDIRLPKPGRYRLAKEPANGSAPVMSELYANDEVTSQPPFFGIVEVWLTQTPTAQIAYTTAMLFRKKTWRYVLVDVKVKQVPFNTDANGTPDLKLIYQPPADPVFPAALSGDTPIRTQKNLQDQETALMQSSVDPTHTPAQRQTDLEKLRLVRSDLGMMQTILSDNRVKAVYLAQLPDALPIVSYAAPTIKLQRMGGADLLPVPNAETPNATIFYTI